MSKTTYYTDRHEDIYADILPLVALGSINATHEDCLYENDIESVLSLATTYHEVKYNLKSRLFLQLDDSPFDKEALRTLIPQCIDFIDRETSRDRRVLVHCSAGISRSASVVIAYVMHHKKISYEDALKHVKDRKPNIAPNRGFVEVLKEIDTLLCP